MKALALAFILSICAGAQILPDAPSTSQPPVPAVKQTCGPSWLGGCWDYTHPTLTIGKTFKSPNFLIPVLLGDGAFWADALESRKAIERGCVESNYDLPSRPTVGNYAVNWTKFELPMDVFEFILIKLNRKPTNFIVYGMTSARVTVHMLGVHSAVTCN